ncbi:MAG TPA: hypothetical protein GX702_12965, partial [Chloroflexi bacterium]|nr:hypothetical protein [Chloroflexota bacterium]
MADVSLSKHRINRIVPALTVVCPALALAGQWALDRLSTPLWGGVLLVLAAASFVAIWEGHPIERDSGAVGVARNIPRAPVVAAVVLGILSFFRLGGNRYSLNGTLLWLGGLICLAAAAYTGPLQLRARLSMLRRDGLYLGWHLVALLGIMALGAFYRLFRIHLIPLEMGCDLPHNYFNIAAILRGEFPVFFPSFPGREGLFFYLASIPSAIFGLSHTTIKATSALVGVATLPAIYALGRELYDREVGLLAAFFMAVGHWHVIMTRVGYRNSMVPLMLTLTWYFAARGLRTGRREAFALSGLCLGLGLHTYNAFMIVPLAVALLIVGEIVVGRGERLRANLANVALLGLVALYLFIPLGRY